MVVEGKRPTNWCIPAVFACFCFWPIGICALISANDANKAADAGDYVFADSKARTARNCVIAAFVFGIICVIITIIARAAQLESDSSHVHHGN
ncbi:Hypothetical predicted protein [Mytilus galloprovincialis]|uniref:Uncharacterized protein n=1 Tax=Mytilus galloprovincialis TaxID=29158 RepID=A0A8B6H945_MYTGA|nr:Hypothetical predicted protein [Mytilus galloprovincialis]